MNLKVGSFTLPVASLSVINTAIIIILVPLMDRLIYPLLSRYNVHPSQLKKIGRSASTLFYTFLSGLQTLFNS